MQAKELMIEWRREDMGWFSWLFEEEEDPPEPLVLGAKLRCPYGQYPTYLFVDSPDIDIHGLPQACVDDCKPVLNILPFGKCYTGRECETEMLLWKQWENPEPQTAKVNGKEIITTKSILLCNRWGHRIEVLSSGQDGIFARKILMIREMEKNYPELKKILDDPYGSVYLHEGMYEEAIRFLEDRMSRHGGAVDLIAMYDGNDMEGAYLKAALGRLMVTCDFKDIATYESSVRRMEVSHGRANPDLNPLMLNQDLLELIKLDAKEANERIGKKGFFRWQEENRKPGDILMEGSNNLAYGLMMYHTAMVEIDALSRQQRDVKMPKKAEQQREIKQQGEAQNGGQEGKGVEGGSDAKGIDKPTTANPYDLTPNQSTNMGRNKFNKFVQDIKENGIQESIKYVEYDGKMYVVDGHHRLKAAKILGLTEVPIEEVQLPYKGYETIQDLLTWGD